jgi:cytochrome c oxidase subunit 2
MKFRVIAHEPAEFDAWVEGQLEDVAAPPPAEIEQIVSGTCMSCHTVSGVEPLTDAPIQQPAPDLTHFGSRLTIAAGMLPNTEEDLAQWLRDPPEVKAGSKMPDYNLTEDQIEALVEYLRSLK